MSVQSSVVLLAQSQNATPAVARRCANFHPSIWGDRFLSYASEFTVRYMSTSCTILLSTSVPMLALGTPYYN